MPAVQSTYKSGLDTAREGMRANTEAALMISRTVEDAAGVGYGKVVKQGTGDHGCTKTLTSLDAYNFLGVTVRDGGSRPENPDVFGQYDSARIMRKGVIWVMTDAAVTAGTDVTVNTTTGGLSSTAAGAGQVAIPNARWESSTSGAGLAKLRLG